MSTLLNAAYFLAVDAGGTKTDYLLADDNRILASTRTGSIKRLRVSGSDAEENLLTALGALHAQSGIAADRIAVTCIGAAGSNVPLVADWMREAFGRHVSGRLLLLEDVEIALDAAFAGEPGVLVLAGTGSNVAGRGADGHMTAAGGWGPALADHGSGYSLGHSALRECFLAIDEGRSTQLLAEILSCWGLTNTADLVERANQNPRPDASQLAALVGRCADAGDAAAIRVVQAEAKALAHLVEVILERLHQRDVAAHWKPAIAFTGSIMEHIPSMREAVEELILEAHPTAALRSGVIVPAEGALWRARHAV